MSDGPMFEQPDFGNAGDDEFDDDDEATSTVGDAIEGGGEDAEPDDDGPNRAGGGGGGAAREVLGFVTEALVDDPSAVVVETSEGRSGPRYSVHVAPGDMGRVIGRRGRTVQALRTLVRAAAATEGRDASVEVVD